MDDAVRVRGVEGIGELDAEIEHLRERQRPLRDQAFERLPLEHFEDEELLVLGFLVLVERADVGMVEGGDGARLDEGAGPIRLTGVGRQPLEHDRPAEDEILGEIDESRCALAELHHDPIVRQRSAGNVHALDPRSCYRPFSVTLHRPPRRCGQRRAGVTTARIGTGQGAQGCTLRRGPMAAPRRLRRRGDAATVG